jgi:YVTN family beta-propeller protein
MIYKMICSYHALAFAIVLLLETGTHLELAHAGQLPALKTLVRQPAALGFVNDGALLLAANRRSGTISVVDTRTLRPVQEIVAGQGITDLAISPRQKTILVCDEPAGELLFLRCQGARFDVVERIPIGASPVSVQVDEEGSRCTVACLWPRRLTVVSLSPHPKVVRQIDLPFPPFKQCCLGKGKLVVADAFAGGLALIDIDKGQLQSSFNLPIHNVRGLALSADGRRLMITHQTLRASATASYDDIHWGNLLTNNIRSLSVSTLMTSGADPLRDSDLLHLGEAGHGTADPAGIVVSGERLFAALSGVHQLAIGREQGDRWQYVDVGRRPTAVVASADGSRIYVANTFSDSISVIDAKAGKSIAEISLGPRPTPSKPDLGEALFYDARLSHDGWLSCHSCHSDGHSNGRLADTLGDGSYGTPKRVLSLLGVGETGPWAWNGSMDRLELQVRKSIESTMQGPKPTDAQVEELTAYLKTLSPARPRVDFQDHPDRLAIGRGREVFATQGCSRCHTPPLYTSSKTFDVGVSDEKGLKQFNPPALRGVSQGGPYFHDGRAATLEEVFTSHQHQLERQLVKRELNDLLEFLNSL